MRADAAPQVRIVAAEAAACLGDPAEAVNILADFTGAEHPTPVRLQALNALTFIGDAARPALPAIARAAEADDLNICNAARYCTAILHGDYDPAMPNFDVERLRRVASSSA